MNAALPTIPRPLAHPVLAFALLALLATLAPGSGRAQCSGTSMFSPPTRWPAHTNPFSVAMGDFDQDGRRDLVVVNNGSGDFDILLSKVGGTFAIKPGYASNPRSPFAAVVVDFNGDGHLDLAITNGPYVFVDLGDGDGTFPAQIANTTGAPAGLGLAVGDFNGDGRSDLAVATGGSSVAILIGNGDGTFTAIAPAPAGAYTYSVAVGDFNHDGIPDLAVGNQNSQDVSVLVGTGGGHFAPPQNYPVGGYAYSVAVSDFNGDGIQDLAVTEGGGGNSRVAILLGQGSGGVGNGVFNGPAHFQAGSDPRSVAVADFNRDGREDLAVAAYASGAVTVLLGSGSGTFAPPIVLPTGTQPTWVAAGDLNADGTPDIAAANYLYGGVSVFLNACREIPGCPTTLLSTPKSYVTANTVHFDPFQAAIGDFNHDGYPDIAATSVLGGFVSVFLSVGGSGTLAPRVNYPAGPNPFSVVAADFNRDGILDLAVSDGSGATPGFSILFGNGGGGIGDGTFSAPDFHPTASAPANMASADFNRDDSPDLAIADINAGSFSVYLGNGAGGFSSPASMPSGNGPYSILAADLDHDGFPDLAVGHQNSKDVWIYQGKGDGAFLQKGIYPVLGYAYDIVAGDFNSNGTLDLAVVNGGGTNNTVAVLFGHGDFAFEPPTHYVCGNDPRAVAAGDFNHDGNQDLVVACYNNSSLAMLIGTGTGADAFRSPLGYPVPGQPTSVKTGDLNHDGLVDLVSVEYSSDSLTVFLGNCLGTTATTIGAVDIESREGAVYLTWQAFFDAPTTFQVERAKEASEAWVSVSARVQDAGRNQYSIRDVDVLPGQAYEYRIAYTQGGARSLYGPVRIVMPTARLALRNAVPNPFRGSTRIDYEVDRAGEVTVEIFNLAGQRVRGLFRGSVQPGARSVTWDGRGQNGTLPAGTYFARLTAGSRTVERKLMLLR